MARGRVILILDSPSNGGRILFRQKFLVVFRQLHLYILDTLYHLQIVNAKFGTTLP